MAVEPGAAAATTRGEAASNDLMRIAIVGVGALGSIYALRLSQVAQVVLVVRDLARAPHVIYGERLTAHLPTVDALDGPTASLEVPDDCDAVLVAVRVDQLTDSLLQSLAGSGPAHRIVVMLTPLLPSHFARATEALGDRLVVAMPGVVAYQPDDGTPPTERRIRYWTPRASPTLLGARPDDDPRQAIILALEECMNAAGLPCAVAPNVHTTNPATTVAFFPLILAIEAAGGSIQSLIDDDALLRLGIAATKETRALGRSIGELASFSSVFLSFASPFTLRAGVRIARRRSPEALSFLEKHFGTKLRGQNADMARLIGELAVEKQVPIPALVRLEAAAAEGRRSDSTAVPRTQ